MTPELDRAILKGMMAVGGHPSNDEQRRTYAQALVAELLLDMDEQDADPCCQWSIGWGQALSEIKRRAGLEGEG